MTPPPRERALTVPGSATLVAGTPPALHPGVHRLFACLPLFALGCVAPVEEHDVAYDERFGGDSSLDLYLPDNGAAAHPTVMFIHGGSWRFGDKDHFENAGRRLARSGYAVASINYRLLPDGVFPHNLEDCLCALAFLRAHAAEYTIDPDRIVVMGYSAGAHLATTARGMAAIGLELGWMRAR